MKKTIAKKRKRGERLLPLAALVGGLVNGLLGTGGGMVMTLSLNAVYRDEKQNAMAISTICVMFFSFLSIILYKINGYIENVAILPVLLPALVGGALGTYLLGRLPTLGIDLLLSALLLYSGVRLLV